MSTLGDSKKISELTNDTAPNRYYKVPVVPTDLSGNPNGQTEYVILGDLQTARKVGPDPMVWVTAVNVALMISAAPQTIVAAPGALKALNLLGMTFYLEFNSIAYSCGANGIYVGYSTAQPIIQIPQLAVQSASAKGARSLWLPVANPANDIVNRPLMAWFPDGAPTLGNSRIGFCPVYSIDDFTP